MDKMIGYCGINCEKCEARIATVRDDDNMREEITDTDPKQPNSQEVQI